MQLYLFAMAALFVPLAYGYAANRTYPSIAVCNKEVVSSIKTLWKTGEKPKNVLQFIEKNGLFRLTQTSYDYYNSENKCIYAKIAHGVLNATFVPKNGNTPANLTYNVEEGDDGIIRAKPAYHDAPEFRWNWYPIYADNGVVLNYVCGDEEGSKEPPVISIMVANNNKSPLTRTAINDFRGLVKGWGLNFKYNYGSECDVSE